MGSEWVRVVASGGIDNTIHTRYMYARASRSRVSVMESSDTISRAGAWILLEDSVNLIFVHVVVYCFVCYVSRSDILKNVSYRA